MNLTKKLAATFFTVVAFVTISQAQQAGVSVTATATANIVAPITLASTMNLQYGNIAVTSSGGDVTIDPGVADGARTKTGGLTFPAVTGTVTRAAFDVTGEPNYTYQITLPADNVVILKKTTDATITMPVNNFLTEVTAPKLDATTGKQTFHVGATLTVASAQASGAYTGDFQVTVDYN